MTFVNLNNRPATKNWNGIVNQLFSDLESGFETVFNQSGSGLSVPVNILETEEAFHLEIAAPGRKKENFSLKVENDQLTLGYEEPAETAGKEQKHIRREFKTGAFSRSFKLNEKVNADTIQAKYEDGLLKVLLPKKAETKPQSQLISIQ